MGDVPSRSRARRCVRGLPFDTRNRLHGRIADSMVLEAGEHVSDQAVAPVIALPPRTRYRDAWDTASRRRRRERDYANLDAITLYQRALQAARHLPDLTVERRAAVYELLGDVQDLAGLYGDARNTYRGASAWWQQPCQLARLALKVAFMAERQGQYTDSVRSTLRGLRLVPTQPPTIRTRPNSAHS